MNRTKPTRTAQLTTLAVVPAAAGAAITGPVADVAALMDHLHATGATVTPVLGGGQLRVTLPAAPVVPRRRVRSRHTVTPGRTTRHRIRWPQIRTALIVTAAVAAASALAVLVWVVCLAVAWLIAHLLLIGAVLAGLAVLAVFAGTGACTTTVRITHHH